jgi:hypothetical protein
LCKELQGVVLPILVEAVEDRIDHSVNALKIGEDHHRPSSTAHLDEAALDGVGGTLSFPQMFGEV